ncbi:MULTISPECIES: hypothetical protein [Enterococcus]|uniref:hypothetical protein n=1 Tax=Enterococcus TaxID=1350 RepID=UPI0018C271AD|nr:MULTISPECIES: hypothetical protein [Enterococcus]MBG0287006.1 hypothetical protein [Enterococcus faecium]MBG0318141.1 hypothetical protein [Enterococcus faecium]MBG0341054.1 hypothetical protein [Enterococcus faecium]MBG0343609.1 hypothetical protein [Enterococcus faecium]MBG0420406.1 hypothetical protein [Enterococcus faecium]
MSQNISAVKQLIEKDLETTVQRLAERIHFANYQTISNWSSRNRNPEEIPMKFFYRIGKEYGVDPIKTFEKTMIYYYHGTPNEVLEHLLEEAEANSSLLELSKDEKKIQIRCVDSEGKVIVGFDIERRSKIDFITQLEKINNLDILTLRPDHQEAFTNFKKQLKGIQRSYKKVFSNA